MIAFLCPVILRQKGCILFVLLNCFLLSSVYAAKASSSRALDEQVTRMENRGDLADARTLLEQQSANSGAGSEAAEALAKFLDRHGDSQARMAYLKWAEHETDPGKRLIAVREAVLLDFVNGKEADLSSDLAKYRASGETDFTAPVKRNRAASATISIPGPLRSFARMAALSPDLDPDELLPALARNVVTSGYEASGNEALQQTEYLRLVIRYVGQARELQSMAGNARRIVIPTCDSEETGNLLKVLGYRMRGACGGDLVLETVNPTRAFLTVDSGFPLSELEVDLRANHRFELPYAPTAVPVLYNADYWLKAAGRAGQPDFLDAFLSEPSLCRLYLGLSHLDRETAETLRKQAPATKLKIYSHVLDFYGSMFQVRNGAAVVPGSPKAWATMVGVSPSNPGLFFEKLMSTDDGWLASYFDALSRLDGPTAAYLTQSDRMRRFYDALRGKITTPGPARPVFRSSTELMLLTTSLRIDPNGQPHVPGDLEIWRNLFIKHPHGKYDGKLTRSAATWRSSDDLLEALFGLSRKSVENEPLKIFLLLNDVDRGRSKPLSSQLAARLIAGFRVYGAQYSLFADAPNLSESAIAHYLDSCVDAQSIRDAVLKADVVGTLQSVVGIWRILVLQNAIETDAQNSSFLKLVTPFAHLRQETEVFEAGRSGVDTLLLAAGGHAGSGRQEQLVELLVGKIHSSPPRAPFAPAENFLRVFDAQRLASLDTLFAVEDRTGKVIADPKTLKDLKEDLSRINETDSTRGSLSAEEKNSFATGYWSERHIDSERKLTVDKLLKASDKKDPRESLAPLLRDSLVGILYSYYAPAGAQLLMTSPMFVRSHDFIGPEGSPSTWHNTEVVGSGWPASGGGRLSGSLISLPYGIAEAEQNFLSPKREQALIWSDLAPQMIADVTIPRWRNIKPDQVRWVALHIRRGRMLLATAALDSKVQAQILEAYGRFSTPAGVEWIRDRLDAADFAKAVSGVQPSILYALGSEPSLQSVVPDVASEEIAGLSSTGAADLSPDTIAHTFGTPKPTLTHSYQPGLLYLRTFPALMGYSSRILAETWESNNLYYAALADEAGVPADQLDAYVPEWNRSVIENIFATHLEDWPAILRSLNTTAEGVRLHNERALVGSAAVAGGSEN